MSTTVQLLRGNKKATKKDKAVEHLDDIQKVCHIVENLDEDSAKAKATELANHVDETYFVLGGVLDVIYNNAWHTGYDTFKDYVEDVHGMKLRKALYLIQIYTDMVESGVAWEKVKSLGWSKLKVISGVITPDTVDDWVEHANNMSVRQLIEYVRGIKAKDNESEGEEALEEEDTSALTVFSVKLHEDQKETVLDAIGAAKEVAGTDYDAVALEYVCMDYLGGNGGAKVSLVQLMQNHSSAEVLDAFEKVYPEVRIVVKD